jgi:hypothetical protein
MRSSALIRAVALALAALLIAPVSALAGTAAWIIDDTLMLAGPGVTYKTIGTGAKGALVSVERCTKVWCDIEFEGKSGWVALDHLSFGLEARGSWTGPHFNAKSGDGTACLYTGANFSGDYLCRKSGFVVTDFARTGLDNRFRSVKINGDASILLCRDLNFTSYCETLTKDAPTLNRFLSGEISSIRIY